MDFSPKSYLIYRFLELINIMIQGETSMRRYGDSYLKCNFQEANFIDYLLSLFTFYKDNMIMLKLIVSLYWQILSHYNLNDYNQVQMISD